MARLTNQMVVELAKLLEPLVDAAEADQPEGLMGLAEDARIDLAQVLADTTGLGEVASAVAGAYEPLEPAVDEGELPDLEDLPGLVDAVHDVFTALDMLDELPRRPDVDPAVGLARSVGDYLVVRHLRLARPLLYWVLRLAGLVHDVDEGDAARVDAHRLGDLLTDATGILRDTYGWGTEEFDAYLLLTHLERVLWHLGVAALFDYPERDEALALGTDPDEDRPHRQLRLPVLLLGAGQDPVAVGLSVLALPPREEADGGLAVVPFGMAALGRRRALSEGWEAELASSADVAARFGAVVRPGSSAVTSLDDSDVEQTLRLTASLEPTGDAAERIAVVGDPQGMRVEVGTPGLRVTAGAGDRADLVVALPLLGSRVVVDAAGRDGFLQAVLPAEGIQSRIDLVPAWSPSRGLHFAGGTGLSVTLPGHEQAVPVRVQAVHATVIPRGDAGFAAAVSLTATARLGPVTVSVDQIGFALEVAVREERDGRLGLLDLDVSPTPPAGLGLAVDAGPVTGSGFLQFDPGRRRYAGAVQLDLRGVAVNAVGVVTTDADGGGYSLLVLVSSADFAPVSLGLGFTLQGVGGVLGVHRSADVDVLRAALREGDGAGAGMLFPADPMDRADDLVPRLRSAFPPTPGRHLVGPAALIGWGTPTMVTIKAAVALELPDPVRLVALAQMRARLPSPERALVRLNMDALGVVDLDAGTASLDAVLHDSRVAQHPVTGEVAMRARWQGTPRFVLAAGGLNPRYEPPPALPDLERLSISMQGGRVQVRLAAYLAVTSNTVQIGARLSLTARVDRFRIEGELQFDTLVELSPFGFVADFTAGVRISWGDRTLAGVQLEMTLAGPAPMHARGEATFEVWRLSHSVSFDVNLGDTDPVPPVAPADPLVDLLAALDDPGAWSAPPPDTHGPVVSLRATGEGARVHPLGQLTVRQQVVPLGIRIDRYGHTELPGGPRELHLDVVLPGDREVEAHPVTEHFAPAQYFALDDHDALSAPAFERLRAGVRLEMPDPAFGGDDDSSLMTEARVGHRTRVIDAHGGGRDAPDAVRSTVTGRHAPARAGRARHRAPALGVRLHETVYVVARREDLRVDSFVAAGGVEGLTRTQAVQLAERMRGDPDGSGLQVVARHESVAALPGLLPPGASPEEPGLYVERGGFGQRVPAARRVEMTPDSDPLPPTQAPGRRWQWVAPLEDRP